MRATELQGLDWINSPQKRRIDLGVTIATMPVWLPLGTAALGISRVVDGKGALFHHERLGQGGEAFDVHKVRTLKGIAPDAQNKGVYDPHATWLGKKLRLLGIDEIPQAVNVLNGQLSLVGPRVMPISGIEAMRAYLSRNEFDEWEDLYFSSKPGGISSYVLFHRQARYGEATYRRRLEMDRADYKNASLRHDLGLIKAAAQTGFKLFFGEALRGPKSTERIDKVARPENI